MGGSRIRILIVVVLVAVMIAGCRGTAVAGEGTADSSAGTVAAVTSVQETGLSDKALASIAEELTFQSYYTSTETSPVLRISDISFAGDAGGVIGKIQEIKGGYDFTVYAFAVNSAENLAELGEFGRKSGVRDFDPQQYDVEFFETGFILVTAYWMSSQGYRFEFSVGECNGELININKVQTHPSLSDREYILKYLHGLYIAYSIISVKYSGQTVYYTETIAP